jgi:hypothetical protein
MCAQGAAQVDLSCGLFPFELYYNYRSGVVPLKNKGFLPMLSISVKTDIKAALLRGVVLPPHVIIEVSLENIGADLWPLLVNNLDVSQTPALLDFTIVVSDNTSEAVRAELQKLHDATKKKAQDAVDEAARVEKQRAIDAERYAEMLRVRLSEIEESAKAPPVSSSIRISGCGENARFAGLSYDGFDRKITSHVFALTGVSYSAGYTEFQKKAEAIKKESEAEIKALNDAAFEVALPRLEAELAANEAEKLAEEQEEAARVAAVLSKRLKTGMWELTTSDYNEKRYSPWWCAKIVGVNGSKLDYHFQTAIGTPGDSYFLQVPCKPGEIISYGQKDNRNINGTEHHIQVMAHDGTMHEITKLQAFNLLTGKIHLKKVA